MNIERFVSRDEFVKWFSTLTPDTSFNFLNNQYCLFATWAKECSAEHVVCLTSRIEYDGHEMRFPDWMQETSASIGQMLDKRAGDRFFVSEIVVALPNAT